LLWGAIGLAPQVHAATVEAIKPVILAQVHFAPQSADLPASVEADCAAALATLSAHPDGGLALIARGTGPLDDPIIARRLSLQRALAVRQYLLDHGVAVERIHVRALGQPAVGQDPDLLEVQAIQTAAAHKP